MYQFDWFDGKQDLGNQLSQKSDFDSTQIDKIQFTFWSEHCTECTAPICYTTCQFYQKRCDGKCKRMEYGQKRITCEGSISGVGSHFVFRPWATLLTYIHNTFFDVEKYKKFQIRYEKHLKLYKSLKFLNSKCLLNNINYFNFTRLKNRTTNVTNSDIFLLELISHEKYDYNMIIESVSKDKKSLVRQTISIKNGFNSFIFDYKTIAPKQTNVVKLYPSDDKTPEITLINAEFIKLKRVPAQKVKCVVWDLDNTIWNGILSETDDYKKLTLRDNIKNTIIELDKRGILQSIASKNNYDTAMEVLGNLGISQYFLYPAINYGSKSDNIQQIAKELNINLDTFLFVDDSVFEREQVKNAIPQIRVYTEKTNILALPECNVETSTISHNRRELYKQEEQRKISQSEFGENYIAFLKSCDISVEIGRIESQEEVDRCYELLSRSNQLNISGHKYSKQEFIDLIKDGNHIYIKGQDKFGKYGIVGYLSYIVKDEQILVTEFAMSCRVIQKRLEMAVLSYISKIYKINNITIIFSKNVKNTAMYNCIRDMNLEYKNNCFTTNYGINNEKIVTVTKNKNLKI